MKQQLRFLMVSFDGERWFRSVENHSPHRHPLALADSATAHNRPEIRAKKIEQLQAAIADGSYFVSAGALAERMLDVV